MEVDWQPEERPESRQDEVSELDNESVAESNDEGLPDISAEDTKNIVKFKLLSPMGGRSIEFTMVKGKANRYVQEELQMHIANIFKLGMGIKEAFEMVQEAEWHNLPWSDAEKCQQIVIKLNKCISSVLSLWRCATRPHTESEWFQTPYCTSEQARKLSFTIFNRVVTDAHILNKCYKSFSSLTYGETSFDQIQILLDRINMTEKDVFVDLGSGVGHVVTYASAYSMAKKCIGIEINTVPAKLATRMKKEFEGMMSWYGKEFRPLDLIQGDFLDENFRKLITAEATVIYINNLAFDPALMYEIRQRVMDMPHGTRIICTKSLSEEREDKAGDDKIRRAVSGRTSKRQTVDMMLDMEELPISYAPVSWSTGKGVQFLLFTVNHLKALKSSSTNGSSSSTRSGSADSIVLPAEDTVDTSIQAMLDAIVSARGGGAVDSTRTPLYPDEDEDDEECQAPGTRRFAGLKTEKRRGRDEYMPDKRNSTGASGSGSATKENKKEKASRRSVGQSTSDSAVHAAKESKVQEEATSSSARPKKRKLGSEEAKEKEEEEKPEDKFPFGKVAAAGHDDDYDKAEAPEWAASVGRGYVAVFAPHHSIFENPEPLPEKRKRKSIHGPIKL